MKKIYLTFALFIGICSLSMAQLQVSITGTTSFCTGQSTNLTAVASGGSAPYNYIWSNGAITPAVVAFAPGFYTVTATDFVGDTATASVVITENPLPNVTIVPQNPEICFGSCIGLTGSGGFTYMWMPAAGLNLTSVSNPISCPLTTTTYTLFATDNNGCSGSATVTVTVYPLMNVNVNNPTICPGDTATLTASGGNSYYWSTGDTGSVISVFPATTTAYTVTAVSIDGCIGTDTSVVSVVPCLNIINKAGTVYNDYNQNGFRDAGEPPIKNAIIQEDPFPYYFSTNDSGAYKAYYDTGSYALTLPAYISHCVVNPLTNTLTSNTDSTNDFGVYCWQYNDLSITMSGTNSRPGFNTYYHVFYQNLGTDTVNSTVSLVFDDLFAYSSSSPVFSSLSNDTLEWNISNLLPGGSGNISIIFAVSGSALIGDTVLSTASITSVEIDSVLQNNIYPFQQLIVGAWDPNEKLVSKSSLTPQEVSTEPDLYYSVHFQNTGTAAAVNIVIKDSLSSDLIIPTLETMGSSHPYIFSIEPNGTAIWTFNNIMLPDSGADFEGSNGFVMFKIKAKGSLVLGDIINNTAEIYFDFNPAVITDTAATVIANAVVAINEFSDNSDGSLEIFPNPANDKMNILFVGSRVPLLQLNIINISGQKVYSENVENFSGSYSKSLDLKTFTEGVYFVQMISENTVILKKVVVIR
jgi:uncharacterized repeat protein (TIGR01451 family)